METGPTAASDSADDVWIPGHWVWQENRYAWRSGIWSQGQPNWVWVPAHYLWAPRGYIFVDGYWDHSVARRGILFAPVRFPERLLTQRGYSYTPSTVIDSGVFADHLFLRPSYGHYYYGDYYGSKYASAGFYPWYSFNSGRRGYDPFYAHQRWSHRGDGNWERQLERDFQIRRNNEGFRPPQTYAAQQALSRLGLTAENRTRVFTQPLEQYSTARDIPVRLRSINPEDRKHYNRLGRAAQAYRDERLRRETQVIEVPASAIRTPVVKPARISLPRSPYVAERELEKEFAPPRAYEFPKPDPRIVPQPRSKEKSSSTDGPRR